MKTNFLCAFLIFSCFLALSPSPAICADVQHTLDNLKNGFMVLYSSEWRSSNFNYRLFRILDKEIEDNIHSMTFGTSSIQLAMNAGKIIEGILDTTFADFQPEYELFFKDFYDKYYTFLEASPIHFSKEKLKRLFLYEEIASLQPVVWQKKLDSVSAKLKKELPMPYISILAIALGFLIIIFRSLFTKNFDVREHRKAVRMNIILVIIGMSIIVLGGIQVSRWILSTQGFTRDFLYDETKNLYITELPETYWAFLEPYIKDALN